MKVPARRAVLGQPGHRPEEVTLARPSSGRAVSCLDEPHHDRGSAWRLLVASGSAGRRGNECWITAASPDGRSRVRPGCRPTGACRRGPRRPPVGRSPSGPVSDTRCSRARATSSSASLCSAVGSGLPFFLAATSSSVAVITAPFSLGHHARRDRAGNTVRSTVPVTVTLGPQRAAHKATLSEVGRRQAIHPALDRRRVGGHAPSRDCDRLAPIFAAGSHPPVGWTARCSRAPRWPLCRSFVRTACSWFRAAGVDIADCLLRLRL
jgi:hypothetical protein